MIGSLGKQQDLLIKQGADFWVRAKMVNPDGSAVNLTNCIIRGGAQKSTGVGPVVPFTVAYLDRPSGIYKFGFTKIQTAAMTCARGLKAKESEYTWELELEDSVGAVIPLFYGTGRVLWRLLNGL